MTHRPIPRQKHRLMTTGRHNIQPNVHAAQHKYEVAGVKDVSSMALVLSFMDRVRAA